jgi:hypothetical protein
VILRLRASLWEHEAHARADAGEDARIQQAQAEIRRLADLRRRQRAGQGLKPTLKRHEPAAPSRESVDALLQALRESLKRDGAP